MVDFKITFKLEGPFDPLEKRAGRIVTEGMKHGYSHESIIDTVLSEYDVLIRCRGEEVFNATVYLNEFLYELLRFAFYAVTGEVPEDVKSCGWGFNSMDELPNWLDEEVRTLGNLLGEEFNELTSGPFLRSFLGSYDPRLIVYGFRKGGHLYFVSVDYRKVCRVPTSEFVKVAMNVIEEAIVELESCTHVFDGNGIGEYREMIDDYKRLLNFLKGKPGRWS
ncbi:hypothetical protein FH039_05540 [Thermococcus indicus]|uniref:Uncharacterized protein n=1 Tax=Thermococcus indicus TaxID=2586643 RepID=A0A4Y5SK02_9EURY|nr:hypothetical protein [Thermococcus indicus]QDA31166.1 hypothetical protein FH039_05540 [Thermococcus indicus]